MWVASSSLNRKWQFSDERLVKKTSFQTILLSSRNAPADSREFVLKFYPFDRATLEHVLSNLVGSLEKRTVAVIESLFKEQGRLLPDGAGREILLREFEAAMPTAKRVLLRPLLGPLSDSGDNPMSVLVFDLGCAIDDLDEDEVSRLLQLGAVVSCTNACTMLRNTADMEMIGTVIGSQNFTSSQLGQILRDALSGKLWSVIDYLLDENQVEPEIAYETLSNCMKLSQHEQSLDVFKKLLELAGKQRHIVSKTGMARRMAEHRGPAWLAEWNKYEARFKGKD